MNGYLKPELVEVSEFVETVNLSSGFDTGNWTVTIKWDGHNGGGHSEFRIIGTKEGTNGALPKDVKLAISYNNNATIKMIALENQCANISYESTYVAGDSAWTVTLKNVNMSNSQCSFEYWCWFRFDHLDPKVTAQAYFVSQELRDANSNIVIPNGTTFSVSVF